MTRPFIFVHFYERLKRNRNPFRVLVIKDVMLINPRFKNYMHFNVEI